jgi:phosphatidylserine decarboxylase
MHIHREGYKIIANVFIAVAIVALVIVFYTNTYTLLHLFLFLPLLLTLIWTISFFRVPHRKVIQLDDLVVSSADGTVVVVEEVFEPEYFKDRRIQVSVFMSPLNVHVNWFPMNGEVSYTRYHPGKFLIANHPKSSTENERNTLVVKDSKNREVLLRQVAGMLARRIICFSKAGDKAALGEEFGLIRFGSRVDFYLPLDATIEVKIGDKVKGTQTVLAKLK